MSAFSIGQKIICIKGVWKYPAGKIIRPRFMQIYTVRAHCPCADSPSILLEEIVNSKKVRFVTTWLVGEPSFAEFFFAPLENIEETQELETVA